VSILYQYAGLCSSVNEQSLPPVRCGQSRTSSVPQSETLSMRQVIAKFGTTHNTDFCYSDRTSVKVITSRSSPGTTPLLPATSKRRQSDPWHCPVSRAATFRHDFTEVLASSDWLEEAWLLRRSEQQQSPEGHLYPRPDEPYP
jgi:hypothetical protein